MAELKSFESLMAFEALCRHIKKTRKAPKPYHREFLRLLNALVREIQDETELALMHGETRHLGEKHMLLTCVYTALSMSLRPVQREASFNQFKQALDTYLGIKLPKRTGKRQQRKLLPHL